MIYCDCAIMLRMLCCFFLLLSFLLSLFFIFSPKLKYTLASPLWKQAPSTWNFNTTCRKLAVKRGLYNTENGKLSIKQTANKISGNASSG